MTGLRIVPSVATDLIERLEKATGPDRGLDAMIAATVGWDGWTVEEWKPFLNGTPGVDLDPDHPPVMDRCPAYTASLDAAETLIPAHCAYEVRRTITLTCSATVYGQDTHADTQGATTALALCIASLRARNGA